MGHFNNILSLLTGKYRTFSGLPVDFTEARDYEAGFAAHYDAYVRPHVDQYEANRLKALKAATTRCRASVMLFLTVIPLLLVFVAPHMSDPEDLILFIVVPMGFAAVVVYYPIRCYKRNVKTGVFPDIISFLGDFSYSPSCPGRVKGLEATGLVPSHDRETSEDEIRGVYKGVAIDFFETLLKRRTQDSKGRTKYTTVFDGIFISLSFQKPFRGRTLVQKDKGRVGNWFKNTFGSLERVALEDPHFEKIFEVYSDDQIEARYLLTPSFMERLKALSENFGGRDLECCFYREQLVIKLSMREDLFEPGSIFMPEDFMDDARRILADMQHIFAVVDVLQLDENTGL
ncbi:DUF3137 domain-containing protein [Sneathiella glossodoripedis]|uniref:DUF3137 domain-containing protein n=1 Tax=Sneathiella glossodoripedis TaxID=418853 RepID=UPI000471C416|nr:DUF3137 domain-containing protein [Sneathiella glossodoripedis]